MTRIIDILNGPNLNLLGQRQPEVYGTTTLSDIEAQCHAVAEDLGVTLAFAQSNAEGALVDRIHDARGTHHGLILNAGAYTHTSIALMDAISSTDIPTIELHLSNIHAREPWRNHSYVSFAAKAVICGFGITGYALAIDGLAALAGKARR